MRIGSIGFLVGEAGRNMKRNGLMSLAALSTVTIALAVLGGALFALYRLHQFAESQPKQFEVEVFLRTAQADAPAAEPSSDTGRSHRRRRHRRSDEDASKAATATSGGIGSRETTLAVQQRIQQLPGVASVTLHTKEQALAEFQADDKKNATNIADALVGNPFPDRLDVRMKDPLQNGTLAARLRDTTKFPEVDRVLDDRETLQEVLGLSKLVRTVGGVAALLLFLATALVIQNTIRLTVLARRKEIRIMQLVGATPAFIRLPMVLEGVFYGLAGAIIASGVVLFVVHAVSQYVGRLVSPIGQALPAAAGPGIVVGALAGLGAVVGWAGSAVSVRRFLRRV